MSLLRAASRLSPALLALLLAFAPNARAGDLPPGFVRLAQVAPTIRQAMRYAGSDNFAGRPLKGYEAPACILRQEAALALARVQAGLEAEHKTLVVYDCYRPVQAVADILAWAKAGGPQHGPQYPTAPRSKLVTLGYIAAHSQHSTGTAVDLGLAALDQPPIEGKPGAACTAPIEERGEAGGLDFGTAFDCFDPKSATLAAGIPAAAAANRALLVKAMQAQGFSNYAREWWHFGYALKGAKAADFPVTGK